MDINKLFNKKIYFKLYRKGLGAKLRRQHMGDFKTLAEVKKRVISYSSSSSSDVRGHMETGKVKIKEGKLRFRTILTETFYANVSDDVGGMRQYVDDWIVETHLK